MKYLCLILMFVSTHLVPCTLVFDYLQIATYAFAIPLNPPDFLVDNPVSAVGFKWFVIHDSRLQQPRISVTAHLMT